MGLYCFWQSCANVSFISSFKDYFSSHKVVRGKAAQHTITIQRKCWDWKNNKLGCCRPQHVARGTWHVSRPASFKLNNTADACPASCVHLPIRQAQLGPDQGQDRAPHLLESGTGNTSKVKSDSLIVDCIMCPGSLSPWLVPASASCPRGRSLVITTGPE